MILTDMRTNMKDENKIHHSDDDINILLKRGVVEVVVKEELEKRLKSGKKLRVKLGIDPTGDKIHIGRAITLRKMRQFQKLGHQAVIVIGDFTGMIGDPSDKDATRKMLTKDQIESNMKNYKLQIGKILDLEKTEFTYNSHWLSTLTFKDVIELAACFTVQQMIVRDLFHKRLESNKPISMHEFMYPLMQGYDSVAIKADIELGGTDQTFNLLAGRTIQKAFNQKPQDIITIPMLFGTDGRKMSTTWGNVITIEDEPKNMFGKVMSITDEMIPDYMRLCTDIHEEEISEDLKKISSGEINPMLIKKKLAVAIATIYHDENTALKAQEEFEKQVQKKEIPDDIIDFEISSIDNLIQDIINKALNMTKSEIRRLMEQGGVTINGEKITNYKEPYTFKDGEIIKIGKRKFLRIKTIKG
jgi:tyrosyl-tRNA synthetase